MIDIISDLLDSEDSKKKDSSVIKNENLSDSVIDNVNFNDDFELDDDNDDSFNDEESFAIPQDDDNYKDLDVDALDNYDDEEIRKQKFADFSAQDNEDPDPDSIINYDEEKRKSDSFQPSFLSNNDNLSNEEILEKYFKDYLVLRKISGNFTKYPHSSRIPSNILSDSTSQVEINDDPELHDAQTKHNSSVVVYKNEEGDIEYIEIMCTCGNKTIIKMKYDDVNSAELIRESTTSFVLVKDHDSMENDEAQSDIAPEDDNESIIPEDLLMEALSEANSDDNLETNDENIEPEPEKDNYIDQLFDDLEDIQNNE